MKSPRMLARVGMAALAVGCGAPSAPRYGELAVSADAPRATLSGRTHAVAGAEGLSPGCPGFLDPDVPEHVLHLASGGPFTLTARSTEGPLALAVAGHGEVRCDSDEGAGHAPHVTLEHAGDYAVHVAALASNGAFAYALSVTPGAGPSEAVDAATATAALTVLSNPPGAAVLDADGTLLGTTPAMFALSLGPGQIGRPATFTLRREGHADTQVQTTLNAGAVVLHAVLQPAAAPPDPDGSTDAGPAVALAGNPGVPGPRAGRPEPRRPTRPAPTPPVVLDPWSRPPSQPWPSLPPAPRLPTPRPLPRPQVLPFAPPRPTPPGTVISPWGPPTQPRPTPPAGTPATPGPSRSNRRPGTP